MPKVIQMPRRTEPQNQDRIVHRSMTLPKPFEESESLSKIKRWLDIADSAMQSESESEKERPA